LPLLRGNVPERSKKKKLIRHGPQDIPKKVEEEEDNDDKHNDYSRPSSSLVYPQCENS
jgi:hypothetical protein